MADKPTSKMSEIPMMKGFDYSKFFGEKKVPPLPDMEALLKAHKRNLEAL